MLLYPDTIYHGSGVHYWVYEDSVWKDVDIAHPSDARTFREIEPSETQYCTGTIFLRDIDNLKLFIPDRGCGNPTLTAKEAGSIQWQIVGKMMEGVADQQ